MAQITIPAGTYLEDDDGNTFIPDADIIYEATDCGDGFYEIKRGNHVYTVDGNDVRRGGLVRPELEGRIYHNPHGRGTSRYDRRSARWWKRGR